MVDRALDQGPAGGDHRHVDPQRLDQGQGMAVTAAGGQYHLNACLAGPPQRRASRRRQLVAAVDQRPVNVDGKEAIHNSGC